MKLIDPVVYVEDYDDDNEYEYDVFINNVRESRVLTYDDFLMENYS